jgi:hypothetical protein
MSVDRQWKFSPRGFNDVEQEVTEADQFNTETVPETEALVREASQNSQDARDRARSGPVRLRLGLIDRAQGLDNKLLDELTQGLGPHLKASGIAIGEDFLRAPSALVVEDFGTEGLTGSIDNENDQGNFRSFWFRHGSSYKRGNKNGRWGLGKLVFPMTSSARCFFGLTIRNDNPQPLLLGQAVLKTHSIGGSRFAPHGHFGDTGSDDRLCPISEAAFIDRFKKAFGLSRTNEPGLSVVVPYPRAEADRDKLLQFVVGNYVFPILTGKLEVDVLGQKVDASTIRTIGEGILKPGLIQFIEDVDSTDPTALVCVQERTLSRTEKLTENMVDADLASLRENYSAGELVGFRVPIALARKTAPAEKSFVDVFFRRRFDTEDSDALYVRGDITIPDEAARFRGVGAFAALLAHDDLISEFLADAENPAHTKWSGTAKRVTDNWKYAPQTLSTIREALPALHRMLATGREQVDARALTNFFWIDDPASPPQPGGPPGQRAKPKPGPTPGPFPPIPPTQRKLILSKRKGGFSIKPGPAFSEVSLPAQVTINICYDVEFGKPHWDKFDFDLNNGLISLEVTGAEEERSDNRIVLTVEKPDFELIVDGFDQKRDLVVDYNLIKAKEAILA